MDPGATKGSGTSPGDVSSTSEGPQGSEGGARPPRDEREPHRIVVDVLATRGQVDRLHQLIGELLCDAPWEHDGPCRIAWLINSVGEPEDPDDPDDVSYGFDAEAVASTREVLLPVEVWDEGDVDRSLGL